FAAIRECYNRRSEEPEYGRLTFCLVGVATPADLIRDTRTTPFNIGRRIELRDFTPEEAAPLAAGLVHHSQEEVAPFRCSPNPLITGISARDTETLRDGKREEGREEARDDSSITSSQRLL